MCQPIATCRANEGWFGQLAEAWFRSTKILELVNLGTQAIIINAPAGCGKTALAAQYAKAVADKQIWVTLDGRDKDPSRLIHHFIEALDATGRCTDRLNGWKTSSDGHEEFAVAYSESLDSSFCVFIDDFHKVAESSQSAAVIGHVVTYCARSSMRVVVTSRSTTGLKLADLLFRELAVELSYDDTSFNAEEISALYSDRFGLSLSMDQCQAVEEATSGWAICVTYLGRLLSSQQPTAWDATISSMRGNPLVSDYLAQEVLDNMNPIMRKNLYLCAIPFLGDTGALVSSGLLKEDELRQLELTGVFTSSFDSRHSTPLLHPIVRRHLRITIDDAFNSKELCSIHIAIGEHFESLGQLTSALHHFEKAEAWKRMSNTLSDLAGTLRHTGEYDTFIFWASRLPSGYTTWQTQWDVAAAYLRQARYFEAEDAVTLARKMSDDSNDKVGSIETRLLHAKIIQQAHRWPQPRSIEIDFLQPDLQKDSMSRIEIADGIAKQVEILSKGLNSLPVVEAQLVMANGHCLRSDYLRTVKIIRLLRSQYRRSHDAWPIARIDSFEAFFHLQTGRPDLAQSLMARAINVFASEDQAPYRMCMNGLVTVAVEMDAPTPELLELFGTLEGFAAGGAAVTYEALMTSIELLLSLGNLDEALSMFASVNGSAIEFHHATICMLLGRHFRVNGSLGKAKRYLDMVSRHTVETEQQHMQVMIERTLLEIATGAREKGLAQLDKLERKAAKQLCRVTLSHIWYAKGRLALEDGDIDLAKALLTKALHQSNKGKRSYWLRLEAQGDPAPLVFAFHEGMYPLFVEKILIRAGSPAARAIAETVNDWPTDAKVRGLRVLGEIGDKTTVAAARRELRSCNAEVKAAAREVMAKLAPPEKKAAEFMLTGREMEILELISRGVTNADISKMMFIEGTTVKTHINRIFRKLGVSQRVQAAVYYRENFLEQSEPAPELGEQNGSE